MVLLACSLTPIQNSVLERNTHRTRLTAHCMCRHMLQFNPDNYKYHHGLRRALDLTPDADGNLTDHQRERLTQLYHGLQARYPRSSAARRIPLDFKVSLLHTHTDPWVRNLTNALRCHAHTMQCTGRQQLDTALQSLMCTAGFVPLYASI